MNDRMREMLQPAPLAEMDDVPRSEIADDALTSSLIASWLTYAQRAGWSTNDELGVALAGAMAREGWRLQRTAFPAPAVSGTQDTDGLVTPAVPSVGLRDRVACELANLEYERSGRPCETEDFYANADRVLSVLHEAGTQEDEDDGYEVMCEPVAAMVEEVRAALAPVQQEPERYSDRERVADYLASAQGVEFHDLNDDARREWLACASDALRAVWSVGRLTDPVQRESEDRITRPGGWHGMMMLTDAAYRSGYEYRKAEFAPVPSVGLRDRVYAAVKKGASAKTEQGYWGDITDSVLSVLHEAGTFEQPDMVVELTGMELTPEQREFVKRAEATFTVTDEVPLHEAGTQEAMNDRMREMLRCVENEQHIMALSAELAQVKAERDEAEGLANRSKRRHEVCEAGRAEAWRVCGIWQADHVKAEVERDTAVALLRRAQGEMRHLPLQPKVLNVDIRNFLAFLDGSDEPAKASEVGSTSSMPSETPVDLAQDGNGCTPVPVQQDEPSDRIKTHVCTTPCDCGWEERNAAERNAGGDEAMRHLRAVVADINPMEVDEMTALLEAAEFVRLADDGGCLCEGDTGHPHPDCSTHGVGESVEEEFCGMCSGTGTRYEHDCSACGGTGSDAEAGTQGDCEYEYRAFSPQWDSHVAASRQHAEVQLDDLVRNEYADPELQHRRVGPWLPVSAEAGTQEDEGAVNAEEWAKADAGKAYLDHVIATVKKHGRHSDTGCPPGFRAMCSEAMALRAAIEAASAVSGTPDTKEDEL